MLIKLRYPPKWFRDFDSLEMCKMFCAPVIPASEWIDFKSLPLGAHLIIPSLSDLKTTATDNKLHVLEFVTYDTYLIHPKKLATWFRKNLHRKIGNTLRQ